MGGDEEGNSPPGTYCRGLGYVYSFEIRRRADDGTASVHTRMYTHSPVSSSPEVRGVIAEIGMSASGEKRAANTVRRIITVCVYMCVCVCVLKETVCWAREL